MSVLLSGDRKIYKMKKEQESKQTDEFIKNLYKPSPIHISALPDSINIREIVKDIPLRIPSHGSEPNDSNSNQNYEYSAE